VKDLVCYLFNLIGSYKCAVIVLRSGYISEPINTVRYYVFNQWSIL